ncbi:hypothetical protein GQ54DRAFT_296773 [Martensiomyces pterosporus]|nr:hypothetical protein GQ54DRAFT_296773 [Martensiomyces pterosporus]
MTAAAVALGKGKGNAPNDDAADTATATSPPLLKTCVMCRARKVKCGGEKPSCVNCIKHRCDCVYRPSVRHMRNKMKAAEQGSEASAQPSYSKQARKRHASGEIARRESQFARTSQFAPAGTNAGAATTAERCSVEGGGGSPQGIVAGAPASLTLIDTFSRSQLMQSIVPFTHSSQPHSSLVPVNHQQTPILSTLPANPSESLAPYNQHSGSQPQQQHRPQLVEPLGKFNAQNQPLGTSRTISPFGLNDSQSSSPGISSSQRWRTLPPLSASSGNSSRAGQPNCQQKVSSPSGYGTDDHHQPSIHDILGGPPLPSSGDIDLPHTQADRTERSSSFAGSMSSFGSPSISGSPAFTGVDPKQLEASLPSPAPDSLDNMLKAYFRYQYPSSGIVLEEFFWYRYRRNMLTPLIIYGMLAVATWNLASDEGGEKYANFHETFYRHAKNFVEDAMDEAHLRSVQGLLVLANYEALVGRWGTMWNHTTMARRLAEGIIFRDTDFPWVGVQRDVFDFEFQRVQRAYWHSLINDIWAAVLMDKQIGGIEILLPPKPTYDFTYRGVHLQHSDAPPGYRALLGPDALQDPRLGNTAAIGELFLLVGQINNCVYLFDHAGKSPSFEAFIDFEMRLTNWCLNLPENVRLDDATITKFTSTAQRADLGEIISTHLFWNFARLLLMKMGLVLSLKEDPSRLRNVYDTKAFYNTDSRALQFYQSSMPILTPDKTASYDEWLFHFCRCMCLQSAQNVVNLLKLGESHSVHPGHFGAGLNLPLVQVISVSLGLVRSPDPQVILIAVDHLATIVRTLLRLKHWFNTAHLLLHLFLAMQDPQLVLPKNSYVSAEDSTISEAPENIRIYKAIEVTCPFPPCHLITELMRRLNITFEEFVKETIRAVRMSSPTKSRIDPCITPLLRHLPEASQPTLAAVDQEPEWFRYAPSYLRSAWKRLSRTYKASVGRPDEADDGEADLGTENNRVNGSSPSAA